MCSSRPGITMKTCKAKDIQADLDIFRNNSDMFKILRNPGIFGTRGTYRTLSNINNGAFCEIS